MGRVPPNKLDEEVKQQENEVYGTDYVDSGEGVYDDTEEMVKDVIGNEPEDDEPFSIAQEVEDDEKELRSLNDDDEEDEE